MKKPLLVAVGRCARCGKDHDPIRFVRFLRPPPIGTHYGFCPTTGEPILMKITKGSPRGKR